MIADSSDSTAWASLIVAVARNRDRRAFGALFAFFAPRIKSYLVRSGIDSDRADELTQEAMLAVWRKAEQYDPARASAAAWIFAIARNLRIDSLRRTRPVLPATAAEEESDPGPLADKVVSADEEARRVRLALSALPPEQAEAMRLAFFEDQTHGEIERLAMTKLRSALKDLA
jgi:RNA polymerase sigma-70 factor, ECF subfamily